jgi:hypothetical protein
MVEQRVEHSAQKKVALLECLMVALMVGWMDNWMGVLKDE